METVIFIIALILLILGLLGSIIPGLPGPPLSFIGIYLFTFLLAHSLVLLFIVMGSYCYSGVFIRLLYASMGRKEIWRRA